MTKFLLFTFITLSTLISYPQNLQENENTLTLFPDGLNFLPLRASSQEAKLGILYYPNSTNLKVDIGNSIDLLKINMQEKEYLTVGIEFMAYAYSMSFSQYRLQIGTLDGFFGGNAAYTHEFLNNRFSTRLRYIHNSAHLVDGYYNNSINSWLNGKTPMPFTRDFAEVIFSDEYSFSDYAIRPYIGGSYAARIRPSILKKETFLTGIEAHTGLGTQTSKPPLYHFFIAYNFQLAGLPAYLGSSQFQAGIKFGEWQKKGINFYISYFKGNNMFNEFYYERIERFGVGFSVDFP
ncbi:MAG: DUF1207 domain-containing protein [Ignavibacteriaceae bacterium]|nr:DUF1207 domain-containing protein [Ignavibacteriaceae bacterium]